MPKCLRFGWYLPYKPHSRELGAWKAYYTECVNSINAEPLSKEDAYKYRDALFRRPLTDFEKEMLVYAQTKRQLSDREARKF